MREWFSLGGTATTRPELTAHANDNDLFEGEIYYLRDEKRIVVGVDLNDSEDVIMRHDTGASGHKLPWLDGENEWSDVQRSAGGFLARADGVLGYDPDARVNVDQQISRSHDVEVNANCGTIELVDQAMTSGQAVDFDVLNDCVGEFDIVILNLICGTADPSRYTATALNPGAGRFTVQIKNNDALAGHSDPLSVRFAILKA